MSVIKLKVEKYDIDYPLAQFDDVNDLIESLNETCSQMKEPTTIDDVMNDYDEPLILDETGVDDWDGLTLADYDLDDLFNLGKFAEYVIDDYGQDGDCALAYVELFYIEDYMSMIDYFCDRFTGEYSSDREFAEQMVDDLGYLNEMPENLLNYFDYDAFARDLMFDYSESNGYYFSNY